MMAVHTNPQLLVLPDESVKLVLRRQLDVPACTFSFCGWSHTDDCICHVGLQMDVLEDPGWTGCQKDQPAYVCSIQIWIF